jgi:hypothetical protein
MRQQPVYMRVDDSRLQEALKRWMVLKGKGVSDALKKATRLICVNLAYQTQPFGDEQGKQQGKKAIIRDLNYIFVTLNAQSMAYFQDVMGGSNRRLVLRRKDGTAWITDTDTYMTKGQMKAFHQSMRTPGRGNVKNASSKRQTKDNGRHQERPRGVVSQSDMTSYMQSVLKKSGIAKGGWAACAKILGGSRGIPQWVTRHAGKRAGGMVNDQSMRNKDPRITFTNMVPWVSKVLSPGQGQRALDIAKYKIVKEIDTAIKYSSKVAGLK